MTEAACQRAAKLVARGTPASSAAAAYGGERGGLPHNHVHAFGARPLRGPAKQAALEAARAAAEASVKARLAHQRRMDLGSGGRRAATGGTDPGEAATRAYSSRFADPDEVAAAVNEAAGGAAHVGAEEADAVAKAMLAAALAHAGGVPAAPAPRPDVCKGWPFVVRFLLHFGCTFDCPCSALCFSLVLFVARIPHPSALMPCSCFMRIAYFNRTTMGP